jgi:DNA-binding NarL/FixJ family response regulator
MARAETHEVLVLAPSDPNGLIGALSEAMPNYAVRRVRDCPPALTASGAELVVLFDSAAGPHWTSFADMACLARTVVITERPSEADALVAIDRGIDGYIAAGLPQRALRGALAGIFRGELAYGRETLGAWLRTRRVAKSLARASLTPRQSQILELIAEGHTDKEIAARLGVRTATAQKHVARLLHRLGARNRAAAVGMNAQGSRPAQSR